MYEIFGIFDSVEEINACAEGLKKENDIENIKILGKENGIPQEMVKNYTEGTGELTDWMNAAIGRLEVEEKECKNQGIPIGPIIDYLKTLCIEEQFARKVRKKNKKVKECMDIVEKKCKEKIKKDKRSYIADLIVLHWARDYYTEG